jgi:hypothetical protein
MNHPSSLRTRKCRNLLAPARVRRQAMARDLDNLWREIFGHATIEKDPQKLGQLTAELETRRRLVEAGRQENVRPMDTNFAKK